MPQARPQCCGYSIAETQLLDRDVELNDLHFLLQGNALSLALCQGDTQQAAQSFQHFVSAIRVGAHQAGNGCSRC